MKQRNQSIEQLTEKGETVKIKHGMHVTEVKTYGGKIRRRVVTYNAEPSMTDQQFAKDADVNHIMAQYINKGLPAPGVPRQGVFGDFTNIPDLRTALQTVNDAQESFLTLDSGVRARFGNDPTLLMDFLADDNNREEALSLGLINAPEQPPAPQKVEIVNPPTPKE